MKQLPGPGKYETIDMLGSGQDFYNSKYQTKKQKSFIGSERFLNGSYFLSEIRKHLDREIIKFSI
jgi:hypothetical protein